MTDLPKANLIACPVVRGMYVRDEDFRKEVDRGNGDVSVATLSHAVERDLHTDPVFAWAAGLTGVFPGEGIAHWVHDAFTGTVNIFDLNTPAVGGINHSTSGDTGMTTANPDHSFNEDNFNAAFGAVAKSDPDGVNRIHVDSETVTAIVSHNLDRGDIKAAGSSLKAGTFNVGEVAPALALLSRRVKDPQGREELVVDLEVARAFFKNGTVPDYVKARIDGKNLDGSSPTAALLDLTLGPTLKLLPKEAKLDFLRAVVRVRHAESMALRGVELAVHRVESKLEEAVHALGLTGLKSLGNKVCPFMQANNGVTPRDPVEPHHG
jgi:hypothetical protein